VIGNIDYVIIGRVFALEKSIDRGQVACFSGYRPHKFDFKLVGDEYKKFTTKLYNEIEKAIKSGFTVFMWGVPLEWILFLRNRLLLQKSNIQTKTLN